MQQYLVADTQVRKFLKNSKIRNACMQQASLVCGMQVRKFLKNNKGPAPAMPHRVIVIGAGAAGLSAALHLQVNTHP